LKKIISSLLVAVLLFGEARANVDLNQSVVATQKVVDKIALKNKQPQAKLTL
jgi:hypothetical protein